MPKAPLTLLVCLLFALAGCAGSGKVEAAGAKPDAPKAAKADRPPLPACLTDVMGMGPDLDVSAKQAETGVACLRFNVELADAPSRGPADAPITLVMFSDFECPYCQRGYELVKEIEKAYPGKIRFIYKAFPIDRHPNAMMAALMAHSAQKQGKFWPFHDLLFSQQGLEPDVLLSYAEMVGLNLDQTQRELAELTYAPAVRRDLRQAKRLDVSATPTFFLNGRLLRGAQPGRVFQAVIDEELRFVEQWTEDDGVAPVDVYEHATRFAYTEVVYENERRDLDEDSVYPVPLGDSPAKGPATAPVTVVVFGDFQCPFCARGFETVSELEKLYEGKIRIVYKHFPLPMHSLAIPAARMSIAATRQGKFWPFHDAVYARRAKFDAAELRTAAKEAGLDLKQLDADMAAGDLDAQLKADVELASRLGVTGTPTFFVNGRPLGGARPLLDFRLIVAEELERAQKRLDAGVPPAKLYEDLAGIEG